jgi:hypothetical protein
VAAQGAAGCPSCSVFGCNTFLEGAPRQSSTRSSGFCVARPCLLQLRIGQWHSFLIQCRTALGLAPQNAAAGRHSPADPHTSRLCDPAGWRRLAAHFSWPSFVLLCVCASPSTPMPCLSLATCLPMPSTPVTPCLQARLVAHQNLIGVTSSLATLKSEPACWPTLLTAPRRWPAWQGRTAAAQRGIGRAAGSSHAPCQCVCVCVCVCVCACVSALRQHCIDLMQPTHRGARHGVAAKGGRLPLECSPDWPLLHVSAKVASPAYSCVHWGWYPLVRGQLSEQASNSEHGRRQSCPQDSRHRCLLLYRPGSRAWGRRVRVEQQRLKQAQPGSSSTGRGECTLLERPGGASHRPWCTAIQGLAPSSAAGSIASRAGGEPTMPGVSGRVASRRGCTALPRPCAPCGVADRDQSALRALAGSTAGRGAASARGPVDAAPRGRRSLHEGAGQPIAPSHHLMLRLG